MKYVYEVARENAVNGSRRGDMQIYHSDEPLRVNELYLFLPGLQGGYRVLRELKKGVEE